MVHVPAGYSGWKITRKVTLDYGLRWDYQTGWHEINSRSSSFAAGIANPAAGKLIGCDGL